MNGEVDVIPHASLRKMLTAPSSCTPNHTSISSQLTSVDTNTFFTLSDHPDFGCSTSVVSTGGDTTIKDSHEYAHEVNVDDRGGSLDTVGKYRTSNSTQSSTLNSATNGTTESLSMTEHSLPVPSSIFEVLSVDQAYAPASAPNCFHADSEGKVSVSGRFDDLKTVTGTQHDHTSNFGVNSSFAPQNLKPSVGTIDVTNDLLLDVNSLSGLHGHGVNLDHRIARMDQEQCAYPGTNRSNKVLPHFTSCETDTNGNEREHIITHAALWGKPNCVGSHSEDLSFGYTSESLPQLAAGSISDTGINLLENGPNPIPQSSLTAVAAAAKRAITGGHQASRFTAGNRPNTWSNNSLAGSPAVSLGSFGPNSWNTANAAKFTASQFCVANQVPPSGISPNNTSPTTWNLVMHQQTNAKSSGVPNIIRNGSLTGLGSNGNGSIRSSLSLNSAAVPGFYPMNVNKSNTNGFPNMHTMFPKRPQHRIMTHWQQQQQQYSGIQHNQINKAPGSIQNGNLQINGNRIPSTGIDLTGIASVPGVSGDNGNMMNFNSGASVLQSLPTSLISPSAMNSLTVGSSGDSFSSLTASSNANITDDNSPLDSFKFGLDQQLMEVIKSFGSTGLSATNSGGANTNNNNDGCIVGIEDIIPSFSDMDQQFSNLSAMNHLSLLGQNTPTSNSHGLSGLNITNNQHAFRNITGASMLGSVGMPSPYSVFTNIPNREEGYSRKVFVGGLPPDIDEEEITTAFRRFGPLIVDWPHKTESKAYFPPKGYCFLLFQDECSVQSLINACIVDEGKYYWCVSSPTMKDKPVQIRPWNLADSDFVMDGSQPLDPRKTIFVGGVPRPLRAIELALIMDRLYSGVCYAGIDTDPELKYPKGAGRVAFSNQQSYIAAISARFVQLQHNEIDKRVEVKPYVLDNQMCDECQGTRCGGKFAPFFCANVTCLQYYCEQCWVQIHSRNGREYHKPLVKEGADRSRPTLYK
ncbi:Cytoplasmic polyadenylation element-binding protein 4 [Paragonimus heterotremus]|uniref:Cytoplasmic polyadenylation element-binding protein 4 n=1 Tax=Paragonimus heterotremus TaxID=100268 RepID=A0A8J4SRA2_9TREM|nr:Cytoplasmic polyadenylation element-binding protein 4 [Paragonimus heterotremus]